MPLPQQQLAFVPIQLRCEPALPCPFDDLQRIVRQGYRLFNLPRDLICPSAATAVAEGGGGKRRNGAGGGRT
jgi:hypothetical protein